MKTILFCRNLSAIGLVLFFGMLFFQIGRDESPLLLFLDLLAIAIYGYYYQWFSAKALEAELNQWAIRKAELQSIEIVEALKRQHNALKNLVEIAESSKRSRGTPENPMMN